LNKFNSFYCQKYLFIGFFVITLSSNTFPSANPSFVSNNTIELKTSSYETYGLNDEKLFFKSKEGNINLDNQEINLIGEVEGKFIIDGETFNIKTESISGNLLDKSIFSKEKVLFETKELEIVSSSMEIIQTTKEGTKILFGNANFNKINTRTGMQKGKANKIELILSKDLIFMQGKAEFHEGNMKVISDEIHYDISEGRILRSVNAKIINSL